MMDPLAGTMAAFGTYAVGFFARPVGGIIFGHYGDKLGRKSMLVTTLMLMGVATVLIGLLPTYSQIGVAAPVLLVALRFVQGVGVGGEWGGAVLMAVEHSHGGRRGFHASWVQAGVPVGLLLANAVFLVRLENGRSVVFELGLASAVSGRGAAARGRDVHPPEDRREPRCFSKRRRLTKARACRLSRCCGSIGATCCARSARASPRTRPSISSPFWS